jgi:hypothetical protein
VAKKKTAATRGQRTRTPTLTKKSKNLSQRDLKKVKGGVIMANTEGDFHVKANKIKITPEF